MAIERSVQTRAKELELDVGVADHRTRLHDLVHDEIARWNEDHRRGGRPFAISDPSQLAERAMRNLTGYGPLGPLMG